ncbi:hypothetical protein P7F88_05950 [Vibrio hannami]|uniref:hypothetical protein n=1 Tax=Vibrio hannami TaxID=2717094 RepID=UPI002410065B|nr:hypothetical protein [Vibrio hannami]MDG3085668.1 hypothetical protein [Vibrio hannami]
MKKIQELIDKKNQWLYSQVDVDFPTAESIKGKALYQHSNETNEYEQYLEQDAVDLEVEIYKADFHRLTVMFAQLQASQYQEEQSAQILEFFAQIIFSEQHDIYLGFIEQKVAFGAIVTCDEDTTLISDIVVDSDNSMLSHQKVVFQLINFLGINHRQSNVWLNV